MKPKMAWINALGFFHGFAARHVKAKGLLSQDEFIFALKSWVNEFSPCLLTC
jgi:hypothetical protein